MQTPDRLVACTARQWAQHEEARIVSGPAAKGHSTPLRTRHARAGWTKCGEAPNVLGMEHRGGCHCGNLRVQVSLTRPAAEMQVRSCACSFCRSHGTRTVSDPAGRADFRATDWSFVERYRFGSRTADYLLCRRCGVYVGAVCETPVGRRAVINTRCLDDRATFVQEAMHPDYDGEAVEERLNRRAVNWTPTVMHDNSAT
jgi:hypothetical protein